MPSLQKIYFMILEKRPDMNYILFAGKGIGDFALVLPIAKAIKRSDPKSRILLLSRSSRKEKKQNLSLLEFQNYLDDVDYYNVREPLHDIKLVLRLRKEKYAFGFVCEHQTKYTSKWPAKLIKICGCKSVGRKPVNSSLHYDIEVDIQEPMHITESFFRLLAAVGIEEQEDCSELIRIDKIKNSFVLSKKYEKYIAICLGTGTVPVVIEGKKIDIDAKSWPMESWIQLIKCFYQANIGVIGIGGKKEMQMLQGFYGESLTANFTNLAGKCTLQESLGVLHLCEAVIGADTGMMHWAAALGKPTISLFGCTSPMDYQPYGNKNESICLQLPCSPCFGEERVASCIERKCMKQIKIEMVFNAAMKYLG